MLPFDSLFARVKEAISRDPEKTLRARGVEHNKTPVRWGTNWSDGWLCPLCDDRSGSCSFSPLLFLRCHQCGEKEDVFEWIGRQLGKSQWDTCKDLAAGFGISAAVATATKRPAFPSAMSRAKLRIAIDTLWESEDAKNVRAFLAERKLDMPAELADLGVGAINGCLIFAQIDEGGRVLDRYRVYSPGGLVKWTWRGRGSGGPGIWPQRKLEIDEPILLMEGEFDVLTAILRLRLPNAFTWTAGASSCPHTKDIPEEWHKKNLHIFYDNDVYQGPDFESYAAPDAKGLRKVRMLLNTLISSIAPMFESLGCAVTLRQCPIQAQRKFGADLRDWVDEGGRDLIDWPATPFVDLGPLREPCEEVTFDEAFGHLNQRVKTRVQVETIATDDVLVPKVCRLQCRMGQSPACNQCPAMRRFPDQIIDMAEFGREVASATAERDPLSHLMRTVVERPRTCPGAELVILESWTGSEWQAGRPVSDLGREVEAQRTMRVVSLETPPLSGEVEITGTVYPMASGKSAMLFGDKIYGLDRAEVDLHQGLVQDFVVACPHDATTVEEIDRYLDGRWRDLSNNVTMVHGRRDILVAHDLLAHSVLAMNVHGISRRGWLDICVFGDTRTGKSLTFRQMIAHHRCGVHHSAVDNLSRAGLVMGSDRKGMMRPGLLPKNHKKMLMIDEWHFMCQAQRNRGLDHPMSWLQGARDDGRVSGVKIYGDRVLPAAVRLATLSNWFENRLSSFEFPCQHLMALYGAPETLARLDFGLAVVGPPSQNSLDECEQFWTAERTRTLILRAWAQEERDVAIDDDAIEMAMEISQTWRGVYAADDLPLFTVEEKGFSLLRIAAAIANLTFSHPDIQHPRAVHVRPVHVEWSAEWLAKVWAGSGYDKHSSNTLRRQTIDRPFEAERILTVALALNDPGDADVVLSQFKAPFTVQELCAHTGKDMFEVHKWIAKAKSLKIFTTRRTSRGIEFVTTKDGDTILDNLSFLASDHPGEYVRRFDRLFQWSPNTPQSGVIPLTTDQAKLVEWIGGRLHEW